MRPLYSSACDLFSILTALLFAVYEIVLSRDSQFIEALRGTVVNARYMAEVETANYLGFLVTIATIPLTIVEPLEIASGSWLSVSLSIWAVAAGIHLL